jgi:import inner membrane translocase subunit TIM8
MMILLQHKSYHNICFISLQEEKKKATINELIAKLTDTCWDKCITGSIGSSFSNSEASCLSNCAKRYADVKMITMQRFQKQ